MISILPKPQMLTVRPGETQIALPLTMHGSAGKRCASLLSRWFDHTTHIFREVI